LRDDRRGYRTSTRLHFSWLESDTQGWKSCRSAGAAIHESGSNPQPQDGEDAQNHIRWGAGAGLWSNRV